jgi:hypothetical protein
MPALAVGALRRAMRGVELGAGLAAGGVERELGELGDRGGHHGQRRLAVAVECDKAFHHQLPHDAQGVAHAVAARAQCLVGLRHRCAARFALGQQREFARIAAAQALHEARIGGQGGLVRVGVRRCCS